MVINISSKIITQIIARDEDGKKIGRLIRAKSTFDEIHVLKSSLLGLSIDITFTKNDIIKYDSKSIWFAVSKNEFNLFVKQKRIQLKEQIKATKFAEASDFEKVSAIYFSWSRI